jgi:hypothetical protein
MSKNNLRFQKSKAILANAVSLLFKVLVVCILLFAISVVVIEFIRILEVQAALDTVARLSLRYAATNQYKDSFCGTPGLIDRAVKIVKAANISINAETLLSMDKADGQIDCKTPFDQGNAPGSPRLYSDAMRDSARYYSIIEFLGQSLPEIIDPRSLKTSICSNRPGFTYQPDSDTCSPQDDSGRYSSSDQVLVSLRYAYPLGSSLKWTLMEIPFHVVREAIMETFGIAHPISVPTSTTQIPTP